MTCLEWNLEIEEDKIRNGGRFGSKLCPDRVADLFDEVLREPEFDRRFKSVVFAILEGRGSARHPVGEQGKFAPFYARFGRWQAMQ